MVLSIIGGVNGTGKSSLSGVLSSVVSNFGVVINPDAITAESGGNEFLGGKRTLELVEQCIENGCDFALESTLSGSYARKVAGRAKAKGYKVRLYYVGLNTAEESLHRIANRVSLGGHHIPDALVHKRFARRFDDVLKLLPLCDTAIFFDNRNGFQKVGEYGDGSIRPSKRKTEWFSQLVQHTNQE